MSPRRAEVSTITGRRQGPALRAATAVSLVLAIVSVVTSGTVAVATGVAAVGVVMAAPLLRVAWLLFRWVQERDWRFVAAAIGLLAVIGAGAGVTLLLR